MRFHSTPVNPRSPESLTTGGASAALNRRGLRFLRQSFQRRLESPLSEHVLDQSEDHPDASRREPQMPVHALREPAGDERPGECPQVDPHVEDGEPRVPPRVSGRVKGSDHRADVRLQQAGADDDECQAGVEEWKRFEGQREMPGGDDDAADEHAAVLAEKTIRGHAAENGGAPHAAGVGPVDRRRARIGKSQSAGGRRRRHIQDQKCAHAVVAEALPHLGEEERRQPARVAEERVVGNSRLRRHRNHGEAYHVRRARCYVVAPRSIRCASRIVPCTLRTGCRSI